MRIDKFLWCIRIFKTRSLATEACKKGRIKVNRDTVKPSKEVFPSDTIEIRKNQINYSLIINEMPKSRVSAKNVDIYRTDTTPKEVFEVKELEKYAKVYYRKKGTGRPSKKDRRDLDDFYDENE